MVTDDAPVPFHSRPAFDAGGGPYNDDHHRDHDPANSTIDHFFFDDTSPAAPSADTPSSSTFVSPSPTRSSIFTRRPRLRPRATPKHSSIIHEWPRGSPLTPPSRQPDFTHVPPTPAAALGTPVPLVPVPVQYGYTSVMQYRMPRVPVRTPLSAYGDLEDEDDVDEQEDLYLPEMVTDTPVPMAGGGMRHAAWLRGGRPHRPKRRDPTTRDGGRRASPRRSETVEMWAQRMLLWTWALVRVAAVLLLAMIAWQIHYVVVQERARRPTAGWTAKMIVSAAPAGVDEDAASAVLATVSEWNATAQVALDVVVEMVGLLSGRAKVALALVVAVAVVPVPRIGEGGCGRRRRRRGA
ncbi:hypothetical protein GGF32_001376 [Allomyces javanicus]|nr:hypothetical protein GGF32_001376 [Allomyces javanicus]